MNVLPALAVMHYYVKDIIDFKALYIFDYIWVVQFLKKGHLLRNVPKVHGQKKVKGLFASCDTIRHESRPDLFAGVPRLKAMLRGPSWQRISCLFSYA